MIVVVVVSGGNVVACVWWWCYCGGGVIVVVEVVWCNGSGSGYEMLVASNVVHSIIRWAYLARKTYYNYKAAGIE